MNVLALKTIRDNLKASLAEIERELERIEVSSKCRHMVLGYPCWNPNPSPDLFFGACEECRVAMSLDRLDYKVLCEFQKSRLAKKGIELVSNCKGSGCVEHVEKGDKCYRCLELDKADSKKTGKRKLEETPPGQGFNFPNHASTVFSFQTPNKK
jgi:hypothetical protein